MQLLPSASRPLNAATALLRGDHEPVNLMAHLQRKQAVPGVHVGAAGVDPHKPQQCNCQRVEGNHEQPDAELQMQGLISTDTEPRVLSSRKIRAASLPPQSSGLPNSQSIRDNAE